MEVGTREEEARGHPLLVKLCNPRLEDKCKALIVLREEEARGHPLLAKV